MKRSEALWLAFEKFAIFFSFAVAFFLVMVLLVAAYGTWQAWPTVQMVRTDVVCPLVADVNSLVDDLGNAVITSTVPISQTIPVVFNLPVDESTTVELTKDVKLNRPTSFTLPAGGGQINGQVSLRLPEGQKLPIHMNMSVPVRQDLPVEMQVDVAIPLKDTELGPVVDKLKALLAPYMSLLDETLKCSEP